MSGSPTVKAQLRAQALRDRDALAEAFRIGAASRIAEQLETLLRFDPGTAVSGFLPIRSEVDLRPAMAALADRGARLCLPAIVDGELRFRQFIRGAALEPQGYGTHAPGAEAAVLAPEIMLVPLAAFDRRLHRIGYGRGYYDRAISALRAAGLKPLTVGVAFSAQEVERVPDEPHDVALDLIATEAQVLRRS